MLDRGEWIASVRSTHARIIGDGRDAPHGLEGESAESGHYLEDHILSRLASEEIAAGEPAGEAWERVRINPGLWAQVRDRRTSVEADLEHAVRRLLDRRS